MTLWYGNTSEWHTCRYEIVLNMMFHGDIDLYASIMIIMYSDWNDIEKHSEIAMINSDQNSLRIKQPDYKIIKTDHKNKHFWPTYISRELTVL